MFCFPLTCEYLGLKYMTQPLLKALEIQVQSSQGKYGKGAHLLCVNIVIRASSLVCLSRSISSAMNLWSTITGNSLLAEVPHSTTKMLGKRETSAGPHVFSITNVLAFLNRQWHIGQCVTVGKIPSQVKPVFNLQMATKLVQALFP